MDKTLAGFLIKILTRNATAFTGDEFVQLVQVVSLLQRIVEADGEDAPNAPT